MSELIFVRECINEILRLRTENRVLTAQVYVVEAFHAALLGKPERQGYGPDLVHGLRRYEHELQQAQDEKKS
jgi:hypothetical protein